jgi:hypothetical protein
MLEAVTRAKHAVIDSREREKLAQETLAKVTLQKKKRQKGGTVGERRHECPILGN